MEIDNLYIADEKDVVGNVEISIYDDGTLSNHLNRDGAIEIIAHLFNVFDLEIHTMILPRKPL